MSMGLPKIHSIVRPLCSFRFLDFMVFPSCVFSVTFFLLFCPAVLIRKCLAREFRPQHYRRNPFWVFRIVRVKCPVQSESSNWNAVTERLVLLPLQYHSYAVVDLHPVTHSDVRGWLFWVQERAFGLSTLARHLFTFSAIFGAKIEQLLPRVFT